MKRLAAMVVVFAIYATTAYAHCGQCGMGEEKHDHAAAASSYPGPQEAAGNIYHQVLDNDQVRVSEITFKPGDKAAMHTHAYPHAVYIIEGGELTLTHPDGTSSAVAMKAGEALWMPAESHEAVNTGTTVVRGTVTEIK